MVATLHSKHRVVANAGKHLRAGGHFFISFFEMLNDAGSGLKFVKP